MHTGHGFTRAVTAVVGLGLAALTLAGCASAGGPGADTATTGQETPSASTTVTAVTTITAPAAGNTATGAAGPAAPDPCPTKYLQAKVGISQGAAGTTYVALDFTNISNTTCTLYGYPGVALAGGSPVTQIGAAATRDNTVSPAQLTLAPGATVNALLRIAHAANYPPLVCHPVAAQFLQIYPPNQTTPIYLGYTTTACAGPVQQLGISAVQPGAGS